MATLIMDLDGLTCDMCVKHIIEDLTELEGVDLVEITRGEGQFAAALVNGSDLPTDEVLTETVQDAGNYRVLAINR